MALVVFDSGFMLIGASPAAPIRPGPDGKPGKPGELFDHLIETFRRDGTTIILPAPAMAELLALPGAEPVERLGVLQSFGNRLRVEAFGPVAAAECGDMKRRLGLGPAASGDPRQKVKFDYQIIATARTVGAIAIYSDDDGLRKRAEQVGMVSIGIWDLPGPAQPKLPFEAP